MAAAVNYRFENCKYPNMQGRMQEIPAGTYPGAEMSNVTVAIGSKRVDLDRSDFNRLKAEGKVRPA